jgi:hypothetical protein
MPKGVVANEAPPAPWVFKRFGDSGRWAARRGNFTRQGKGRPLGGAEPRACVHFFVKL